MSANVAADANAAATPTPGAAAPGKGEPSAVAFSRIRRTMSRRMAEMAQVPAFYLRADADVSTLLALRRELREQARTHAEPIPSVNDFVIAACARALREHPLLNASLAENSGAVVHGRVNVGFALAADSDELLVPTVYDADAKSAAQIAGETRALVSRAPRFTIDELRDGTFTVSNLGMFGVHGFDAIVNGPQVAILAVGAARPVAENTGRASHMQLSLGCDHRVLTGTDGARFLANVRERLEGTPRALLEPGERRG